MAWAAVAGAAVSVVGGALSSSSSSKAANKASKASQQAADQATALQEKIYTQNRADQEPWRTTGGNALSRLSQGMGLSSSVSNPDRNAIYSKLKGDYTTTGYTSPGDYYGGDGSPPSAFMGSSIFDDPRGQVWDEIKRMKQGYANSSPVSTVDTAGLNKAVDDEYARQLEQYNQGKNDPFYGSLLKDFSMADYQEDPGYKFRLSEGMKGLDRSAAARGGLQSGAALKAAANYSEDAASQEYGNAYNRYNTNRGNQFNRLATLAGVGQTANAANTASGVNYANTTGNILTNNGDSQGNAIMSAGNARGSAYTGIAKTFNNLNWNSQPYNYSAYNQTSDPLGAMISDRGW